MRILRKVKALQKQAQAMTEVRRQAGALQHTLTPEQLGMARSDLTSYFRLARGLEPAEHQVEILERVQHFVEHAWSQPSQNVDGLHILTVNLPPGAGKSMTISQTLPEWVLGNRPDLRILIVSAAGDLAANFQNVTKSTIASSPLYRTIFPDERARPDRSRGWSNDALYLKGLGAGEASPSIMAVGLGGSLLGKRADLIILDDPQTQVTSGTPAARAKAWDIVNGTVLSRGVTGTPIICVQQRLHEDDITAQLQRHYNADSIVIRAIKEDGTSFWPHGMPIGLLNQKRRANPPQFESMYNQAPTSASGSIFKPEMFAYHDGDVAFDQMMRLQSWDTAFTASQQNDFCSFVDAYVSKTRDIYIVDMGWQRHEFPGLLAWVTQIGARAPRLVLIEDKASGSSLTQTLRATTSLPVKAQGVVSDKVSRANATTGWFEARKVFFPRHHPLLAEFEAFLTGFPGMKHDDPVDALTQLIAYVIGQQPAGGKTHKVKSER